MGAMREVSSFFQQKFLIQSGGLKMINFSELQLLIAYFYLVLKEIFKVLIRQFYTEAFVIQIHQPLTLQLLPSQS